MGQTRSRRHKRSDEGSALILVLIISVVLLVSATTALAATSSSLALSSGYGSSVQSNLAAQAGLNELIAEVRYESAATGTYSDFACGLAGSSSLPGATSTDTVSASYSANGTALTCTGSAIYNGVTITTLGVQTTPPTAATVTSTGSAPHASKVVMAEGLTISVPTATTPRALNYAIFTLDNLGLQGNNRIEQASGQQPPDIYAGRGFTCANGDVSAGGLTAHAAVDISGGCTLQGNLVSSGSITLGTGADIGSVTSYSGGILLSGDAKVAKNATAYNGFVQLDGPSQIGGNAEATGSGTSTLNDRFTNGTVDFANPSTGQPYGDGEVIGNASAQGLVTYPTSNGGHCSPNDGWVCGTLTQNDATLTTPAAPTQVSFPSWDPTVAQWQAARWNVVEVGGPGQPSCAQFFANYPTGASDEFMDDIATVTQPTVFYAPTCSVFYNNTHTFDLNNDVALQVQSLNLQGSNTIQMTSTTPPGTVHGFGVVASAGTACDGSTAVSISAETVVKPSATLGLYTEGEVDAANRTPFDGQVLACGGFTGADYFEMSFVPGVTSTIPHPVTTPPPPTETILNKHLEQG